MNSFIVKVNQLAHPCITRARGNEAAEKVIVFLVSAITSRLIYVVSNSYHCRISMV